MPALYFCRMKYQRGDKIILLHSEEEGEIIDFINDKMVMVEVKGVKFPVFTDQIDFPYFKRFSAKGKKDINKPRHYVDQVKKEKANAQYKVTSGMWLAFLPVFDKDVFDEDMVEYFKIYLVNQTPDDVKFSYHLRFMGKADFDISNEIPAFSDFYLHDVPLEDLNDSPRFDFEFSLKTPDKTKAEICNASYKIKPKQLFQKIAELRQKQEASFSYQMYDTYPDRALVEDAGAGSLSKAGYKVYDASKFRKHTEPPRSLIDLHIEKLTDDWQRMGNYEKLSMQLKTFEKYYELAVLHHQPQLIVIHGVGTGKLRDEIHDILRLKKEVKSFVNQYHPSFGYGATEIYFQY